MLTGFEMTPLLEAVSCTPPDVCRSFGKTATMRFALANTTGSGLPFRSNFASEPKARTDRFDSFPWRQRHAQPAGVIHEGVQPHSRSRGKRNLVQDYGGRDRERKSRIP